MKLALAMLAVGACTPMPVMRPRPHEAPASDAWQRSATWLYATADAASGHAAECKHVRGVLDGESTCRGALCRHGSELANEWLDKCAKLLPAAVERTSELQAELSDRADRKPSLCAKQLMRFVDDGCDEEHCAADAQAWATRCGETEASPLALRILARAVSRHGDAEKPIELDGRSCKTLATHVAEQAHCATESSCKKAWKLVQTHRARCHDPNRTPDLPTAMRVISIASGALRDLDGPTKISNKPERLAERDLPLVLADGLGAVFAVCHHRVTTLSQYLEAQTRCDGGFVAVARAFERGAAREIRLGEIPIRASWDALQMFPSLAVAGEHEHAENVHATTLAAAIDRALQSNAPLGPALVAIDAHAPWLLRSARVRNVLADRDRALVPVFEAAAEAKVAASHTAADARGLAFRAKTWPLADLAVDGTVNPSTTSVVGWLQTHTWLPLATGAYRAKLATFPKQPRSQPHFARQATTEATTAAHACRTANDAQSQARLALERCVFEGCDDTTIQALAHEHGEAVAHAAAHLRDLRLALSKAESDQLLEIADAAGCPLPELRLRP